MVMNVVNPEPVTMDSFITKAIGILNNEIDLAERRLSGGCIDLGGLVTLVEDQNQASSLIASS